MLDWLRRTAENMKYKNDLIQYQMPTAFDSIPPYLPTYRFKGDFIGERHAFYSTCPMQEHLIDLGVDGWLRREDALKLYEMAYFARGPILELGSYHGLSTLILSRANHDSGLTKEILSIELDPVAQEKARKNLEARDLAKNVRFIEGDAVLFCLEAAQSGKSYDFVFIDYDHSYASVLSVCRTLGKITAPGGFCLFHDWLDSRNYDPENKDYGVFQAVRDGLNQKVLQFYGVFGVAGLYRRRRKNILMQFLQIR